MNKLNLHKLGLALLALTCFSLPCHATRLEDINSKQTQLKNLSSQIEDIKKELTATQWQQSDLQDQLKVSELKLALINKQMEQLNQDLKKAQTDLEKTKSSQLAYTKQLDQQHKLLGEQVRILYQLGQKQSLKTILNPENINKIDRHLTYYHYLNQAHLKTITDIKNTLVTLNNNMELMAAQEQNFKTLLQQKRIQQQQELAAQERREGIIRHLEFQMQDKQQRLSALADNQKSLQDTLDGLLSKTPIFSNAAFAQLRGKLSWPLQGKMREVYSAKDNQRLNGVVIAAAKGTPVKAIYGGKVIFANWLRGFGLLVIINHGDGFMSLYGHNHALFAKVGDVVDKNDVIAKIGDSSEHDQSSLYFEIRRNGNPVDPRHWCV